MEQSILHKVVELMNEVEPGCTGQIKSGDENIIEDLGFDSISIMSLLILLEKEFDISFDGELLLLDSFDTVNELCEFVSSIIEDKVEYHE